MTISAQKSGPVRAGGYIARIEEACMGLATFPKRGTRRDDIAPGLRTIGFERRVTIAFRVLPDAVEIVTIAYAGQDFELSPARNSARSSIGKGAPLHPTHRRDRGVGRVAGS